MAPVHFYEKLPAISSEDPDRVTPTHKHKKSKSIFIDNKAENYAYENYKDKVQNFRDYFHREFELDKWIIKTSGNNFRDEYEVLLRNLYELAKQHKEYYDQLIVEDKKKNIKILPYQSIVVDESGHTPLGLIEHELRAYSKVLNFCFEKYAKKNEKEEFPEKIAQFPEYFQKEFAEDKTIIEDSGKNYRDEYEKLLWNLLDLARTHKDYYDNQVIEAKTKSIKMPEYRTLEVDDLGHTPLRIIETELKQYSKNKMASQLTFYRSLSKNQDGTPDSLYRSLSQKNIFKSAGLRPLKQLFQVDENTPPSTPAPKG